MSLTRDALTKNQITNVIDSKQLIQFFRIKLVMHGNNIFTPMIHSLFLFSKAFLIRINVFQCTNTLCIDFKRLLCRIYQEMQ